MDKKWEFEHNASTDSYVTSVARTDLEKAGFTIPEGDSGTTPSGVSWTKAVDGVFITISIPLAKFHAAFEAAGVKEASEFLNKFGKFTLLASSVHNFLRCFDFYDPNTEATEAAANALNDVGYYLLIGSCIKGIAAELAQTGLTATVGSYAVAAVILATAASAVGLEIPGLPAIKKEHIEFIKRFFVVDVEAENLRESYERLLSVYNQLREKHPFNDDALSMVYDMLSQVGKERYGEDWNFQDFSIYNNTLKSIHYEHWPVELREKLIAWALSLNKSGKEAQIPENLDLFWKSKYCPPELREPADADSCPPGSYFINPDNPGILVDPATGREYRVSPNLPPGIYAYDPERGCLLNTDNDIFYPGVPFNNEDPESGNTGFLLLPPG